MAYHPLEVWGWSGGTESLPHCFNLSDNYEYTKICCKSKIILV